MADVFRSARAVLRDGTAQTLTALDLNFTYRNSTLPPCSVLIDAVLQGPPERPEVLTARMDDQIAKRDATQPTKDRTAGSTFRNPAGHSSTGRADDRHDLKAWKVIDDAGLRGATLGGAVMNPMHPNFLTNAGSATAADLEDLGELVRKKVYDSSGITLEWEIMRIGDRLSAKPVTQEK
jgi:UDP-N-acetylmuramate dehydrogenase